MVKKSFVNYIGSKYYHIREIGALLPLYKLGLDLFGGSGVVAMNFNLAYNDKNDYVYKCYRDLKQVELDKLVQKYELDKDLKPYTAGDFRVSTTNYGRLVNDFKSDQGNIYLEFLVKFYAHSMDKNVDINSNDKPSGGRSGKFRYPKIVNQKLFLDRPITHKSFTEIDFSNYDFIFCDPPYITSDYRLQYGGWTVENEKELLEKLASYRGKFLITNYLNEYLQVAIKQHGWYCHRAATRMNSARFMKHDREEYYIYNYKVGLFNE